MASKRRGTGRKKSLRRTAIQGRARVTVEVILETTAQLLVKHGYQKLTTNHVAQRAGVSVGSIYQYFRSKDELVTRLVDLHIERRAASVMSDIAEARDQSFGESVRRVVAASIRAQKADVDLNRALLASPVHAAKLSDHLLTSEMLIHAALEAGREKLDVEDTRMLAFLLVHVTQGVVLGALTLHPDYLDGDRIADEIARMFATYDAKKGKPP